MAARTEKRPGPEVRRRQIIDAAIEVFGRKSYYGGTTKQIAVTAGVSERMIFFYFENKKKLFRETLKKVTIDLVQATQKGKPPVDDIRTFIKMTMRNYMAFLEENPLEVKLLLQSVDVIDDPEIKEDLKGVLELFYEFAMGFLKTAQERGQVEKDQKPSTVTIFCLGLIMMVSCSEFLGIEWFRSPGEDIYTISDSFVDAVTGH